MLRVHYQCVIDVVENVDASFGSYRSCGSLYGNDLMIHDYESNAVVVAVVVVVVVQVNRTVESLKKETLVGIGMISVENVMEPLILNDHVHEVLKIVVVVVVEMNVEVPQLLMET